MAVKFIHIRKIGNDDKPLPNGGMTIAYVIDDTFKVVGMAAARCHSNDRYVKAIGRKKSESRLRSDAYYADVPELSEQDFRDRCFSGYYKFF